MRRNRKSKRIRIKRSPVKFVISFAVIFIVISYVILFGIYIIFGFSQEKAQAFFVPLREQQYFVPIASAVGAAYFLVITLCTIKHRRGEIRDQQKRHEHALAEHEQRRLQPQPAARTEQEFMASLSYDEYMDIYGDCEELREMNEERLAENAAATEHARVEADTAKHRSSYGVRQHISGTGITMGASGATKYDSSTGLIVGDGGISHYSPDTGMITGDGGTWKYNREEGYAINLDNGKMIKLDKDSGISYEL